MAPRNRTAARGDGARVRVLSRLHQGPRPEAQAHARLQPRLHAHPEIGPITRRYSSRTHTSSKGVNAGEKMYQRAGVKLHHRGVPNAPPEGFLLRDKQDEKRIA